MKRDFLKRLRAANAKVERLKSELLATLTEQAQGDRAGAVELNARQYRIQWRGVVFWACVIGWCAGIVWLQWG